AGPGQSCWLIDVQSSKEPTSVALFNGKGGTALAWHPSDPGRLIGGDSIGRVASIPEISPRFRTLGRALDAEIVGLASTRSGDRLAVASREGTVAIIDPRWAGEVMALRPPFPELFGLRFDH